MATLTTRAASILNEIRSSGSALVGRNDHAAIGELARAGHRVRWVLPRDTMIRDMADLRDKGFDEVAI